MFVAESIAATMNDLKEVRVWSRSNGGLLLACEVCDWSKRLNSLVSLDSMVRLAHGHRCKTQDSQEPLVTQFA